MDLKGTGIFANCVCVSRGLFFRVLTLWLAFLLTGFAHGVGLGELQHRTFIGQTFNGQIELIGVEALSSDQIRIRQLNDLQAADRGLETFGLLPKVNIQILTEDESILGFSVQSLAPVSEPYFNLVFELTWPSGSVLREYGVLLDAPPRNTESSFDDVSSTSISDNAPEQSASSTAPRSAPAPLAVESPPQQKVELGGEYAVRSGDTLFGIVSRIDFPDGVSWNDMVDKVYQANPEAFEDKNINALRAGAILGLPAASSFSDPSRSQQLVSRAELQSPNESGLADEVLPKAGSGLTPEEQRSYLIREGRLSLSDAGTLADDGADYDLPQIREQVDGAQEMIDLLVRENQDLRERIEQIESSEYLTTLSELVSLQKRQIEELREEFRAQSSSAANETSRFDANGTSTSAPIPLSENQTTSSSQSFSQKLAQHFWVFVAFLLLTLLLVICVVFLMMRRWSIAQLEQAAYTEYSKSVDSTVDLGSFIGINESANIESESEPPANVANFSSASQKRRVERQRDTVRRELQERQSKLDEEVKQRIRQKTEQYDATTTSEKKSSTKGLGVEMVYGLDEEVNELLSMAKIYCSAGKYSEARAILSAQNQQESDPRLLDALQQINALEKESNSRK